MSTPVRGDAALAIEQSLVPSLPVVGGGVLLFVLVNGTGGRAAAWLALAATVLGVALVVTLRQGLVDLPLAAIADWSLVAMPGLFVVFLSFNGGGFFPGSQGLVAFLLSVTLALRIALVPSPFSGISRLGALASAALVLYGLWQLLSGAWSHTWGRAFVAFDESLLYALTVAVFTSVPRTTLRLRWMARGVGAAAVLVCTCGLITRLLPHVWPIGPGLGQDRLAFPLTYWNALGILAGTGMILAVYATTSLRENRVVMAVGAAAIPLLATTLYFTFSRGGIGATAIGVALFLLVARPRGVLGALVSAAPTTAVALHAAYGADLLSSQHPTVPGAVSQGHHVAAVLFGCVLSAAALRVVLLPVDRWAVTGLRLPEAQRLWAVRAGWATLVLVVVAGAAVFSHKIDQEWAQFVSKSQLSRHTDLRTRLTDPSNNHRVDQWRVGMHAFENDPARGHGAGTYQVIWAQHRPDRSTVRNAHSLYVESLAEVGVIGTLLLAAALAALVVAAARQVRGVNRSLYAAVLAVLVTWLVHAGVDWDWQMPAVTLPVLALASASIARAARRRPFHPPALPVRGVATAVAIVLGIVPVLLAVSQHHLAAAASAAARGDCRAAVRSAQAAADALPSRPEPYQQLAYCEQALGNRRAALADIEKAIDRDRGFWRYQYDKALIAGITGSDPRPPLRRALALDPNEVTLLVANEIFTGQPRSQWASTARTAIATGS
jgi:hypothetical protein